jgi:hypothetical protein
MLKTKREKNSPQDEGIAKRAGTSIARICWKIIPKNRHGEVPSGPDLGKERVEWFP